MPLKMELKTPLLFVINSEKALYGSLQSDGSYCLTYELANSLILEEPHVAKLLSLRSDAEKQLVCTAGFVKQGSLDGEEARILGTSIAQSNVYVPVTGNHIPAIGWLSFSHLDATPIVKEPLIHLAIHVAPVM
jgi:hypothetical protein